MDDDAADDVMIMAGDRDEDTVIIAITGTKIFVAPPGERPHCLKNFCEGQPTPSGVFPQQNASMKDLSLRRMTTKHGTDDIFALRQTEELHRREGDGAEE